MKETEGIGLSDVQRVYDGVEGDLRELLMGEQLHVGGFSSSMDLAERAGVGPGHRGIDLGCGNGAGMRFLVRYRRVDTMHGVDAAERMVNRCRERCLIEGLASQIDVTLADACDSGLPGGEASFVWGEDAWCYAADKSRLVAEAVRLVRPGGTIAFTDWVEGSAGLSDGEADRLMRFMKFPNLRTVEGYAELLTESGADLVTAGETDRLARNVDFYREVLDQRLTYDALKVLGFDMARLKTISLEMAFLSDLAHRGKVAQGLFVAMRRTG